MRRLSLLTGIASSLLLAVCGQLRAADDGNWPQFRGPTGDGHAVGPVPLTWSETDNVAWKTPIHDEGWSSPVVWGDQVWLTTATPKGTTMYAVCVDRMSGKVIHDLKLFEVGKPGPKNATNTYASPTPVIEAGRVFVHFGSYGTACLDTATGKTLWSRNDLPCDHEVAPGSSPIIVGNRLIVHLDGMDHQYVIALDKATGATVWRTPRSVDYSKNEPLARKAFSTPAVTGSGAAMQLISTGADATMGYDAATGRELWQVRYKGFSNIMRPVVGGGMTFINTGFGRPHLMGIRLGGSGDVTATHVAWDLVKNAPLTCSPILLDGLLYVVSDGGFATCLDAATGAVVWTHKLGGEFGASPVLAAGRLYFFGKKGVTTVMEPGRTAKVLATNQLDPSAPVMASPAVAGGALFLRSKTHLYRIAAQR